MIGTTIWGAPGLDQLDRLPTVPVVSVDKDGGDTLKRLLGSGGRVRLKITTEVKTGWTPSLLPEARIPGTREPELFVMIGAHYCSWDVGITDNATGDACLLEMARILWAQRDGLRRSVRLVLVARTLARPVRGLDMVRGSELPGPLGALPRVS